jgi:CarD family transcriptional regulator
MDYELGDTVVHPQHGAAVVEAIRTRDLGQGPTEYLELHVEASSMRIMVPASSADEVGLRPLASKEDAEAILAMLAESSEVPLEWKDRNTFTTARMKSRELVQVAMVVRDLMQHEQRLGKPLTLGERTSLNNALGLLASELSLSLGMSVEDTMALLSDRGSSAQALSGDVQETTS